MAVSVLRCSGGEAVAALVAASAIRTCLGNGGETFSALMRGRSGVNALKYLDPDSINITHAYQRDGTEERVFGASDMLRECLIEALHASRLELESKRVVAVVGTGLRELRAVERVATSQLPNLPVEKLHFAGVVREVFPQVGKVVTLSNACSAGGHALAVAQDVVECGDADIVIAAATDTITASMLAMIGRFATEPGECVRPFDVGRRNTLLGEGAGVVILTREGEAGHAVARLLSTGLSCDARHETVPCPEGIRRAVADAFARGGRAPRDVDLVVAHGTGTLLNDPMEAQLIAEVYGTSERAPCVAAVKGAVGHTSGSAALVSLDVALHAARAGCIPPVVGLEYPIEEARYLKMGIGESLRRDVRLAVINAFGFGGVNAVTLLETLH